MQLTGRSEPHPRQTQATFRSSAGFSSSFVSFTSFFRCRTQASWHSVSHPVHPVHPVHPTARRCPPQGHGGPLQQGTQIGSDFASYSVFGVLRVPGLQTHTATRPQVAPQCMQAGRSASDFSASFSVGLLAPFPAGFFAAAFAFAAPGFAAAAS